MLEIKNHNLDRNKIRKNIYKSVSSTTQFSLQNLDQEFFSNKKRYGCQSRNNRQPKKAADPNAL